MRHRWTQLLESLSHLRKIRVHTGTICVPPLEDVKPQQEFCALSTDSACQESKSTERRDYRLIRGHVADSLKMSRIYH
jgi:hypothetical protein